MRWMISILLLMGVVAPMVHAQTISVNQDLDLLWSQVRQAPDDFSVVCIPLHNPENVVLYHPDEPFPLASVSKLLVFIEYARQVDAGLIPLGEMVSVEALNRFNLPRTNDDAHEHFLSLYPDDVQVISLWDIAADGMMQYSSNAATDYVLNRISPVNWNGLFLTLNISATNYPHSLTLIPLIMGNHETGQLSMAEVSTVSIAQGERFLMQYTEDNQWRSAEIDYRYEQRRRGFPNWNVQSAILNSYTAKGTTRDFIKVMNAIYGNSPVLTPHARQLVRDALRWTDNPRINNTYVEYGSKLGFYSGGTLALVAYGEPIGGEPVISATFFRDIPQRTFYDLLRSDSIGNLAHWMNLNGCTGLTERIQG